MALEFGVTLGSLFTELPNEYFYSCLERESDAFHARAHTPLKQQIHSNQTQLPLAVRIHSEPE